MRRVIGSRTLINGLLSRSASTGTRPADIPEPVHLRRAAWLRQDPVVKWTMVLDAGRHAHKLLASHDHKAEQNSRRHVPSLVDRVRRAVHRLHSWKWKKQRVLPPPESNANLFSEAQTFQELPYEFRLGVILSSLMWIRSVRDVQDTIAREHLPYAEQRRIGKTLCCRVYPMRMAERWVDGSISVDIMLGEENESGEQIPPPHLWDTEKAIYIYDSLMERTTSMQQTAGRGEVSKGEMLARVKNLQPKLSADDEDGKMQQQMMLLPTLRSRRSKRLAAASGGSALMTHSKHALIAQRDMMLSSRPSPLWADVSQHAEDEEYHRNTHRAAGCPLDEHGDCAVTSIFIPCPRSGPSGLGAALVAAHASILSAMFIEGRPAHFSTNHPVVLDYVNRIFAHIIEDRFLSATLCNGEGEAQGRRSLPYLPEWFYRHAVVVLGADVSASDIRKTAEFVVRCSPQCVLCETDLAASAIRQECVAMIKANPKIWNPMNVLWSVLPPSAAESSGDVTHRLVNAASTVLCHYHFVSIVAPDLLAKRTQKAWQQLFPRSNTPPIVAVNYPATAAMLYFPMTPLLVKKLGNSFRYFHPERAVLSRPYKHLNNRRGVLSQFAESGFEWDKSAARGGSSVLVLERSLDYLADPCKYTMLTLAAAKWFRI